jgi:uncharacterized protein YjbJ (UPF0337 family)
MDKDTLKGKGKDIAGRVERQVGEWTDREDLQIEGAGKQVEGKVQKGVGKLKEMGRDAMNRMGRKRDLPEDVREEDERIERDRQRKTA